ncbi:MAG: hypothetical protein M1814_006826 [Vezdaea aestivalis]|nr:MAG: hypothetical protein M1814_006826 [Vezdaea aestivalis]
MKNLWKRKNDRQPPADEPTAAEAARVERLAQSSSPRQRPPVEATVKFKDGITKVVDPPEALVDSTIGILFLGTPHNGSDLAAWGRLAYRIISLIRPANVDLISTLRPNSETLQNIQADFYKMLRLRADEGSKIEIVCFFEELPSPIGGEVVDHQSASIRGYHSQGIRADHANMSKFQDKDDPGYECLLGELRRWIQRFSVPSNIPDQIKVHGAVEPLLYIPFDKDEEFVERSDIISKLNDWSKGPCRVAMNGIGGIGKSQIAIEYCYRYRERHPSAHILWVHCLTTDRFGQAYRDIAQLLALPGHDDPNQDTLSLVCNWLNNKKNEWCLVLDNLDELETVFGIADSTDSNSPPGIKKYLPKASEGFTLVTTRDGRVGNRLGIKNRVEVTQMSVEDSRRLFKAKISPKDICKVEELDQLLKKLDFVPLAITQAAAHLNERPQSPSTYLQSLSENDSDIHSLLEKDSGDIRRDGLNSVIKTWKVSFDLIRSRNKLASDLLSLMCLLDRQGIPHSLLSQWAIDKPQNIPEALGILKNFSLISVERGGSHYAMHRLVQLSTNRWLCLHDRIEDWKIQALTLLNAVFPSGFYGTWTDCDLLSPHALCVSSYQYPSKSQNESRAFLLSKLATFEESRGLLASVLPKRLLSLKLILEVFDENSHKVIYYKSRLASAYWQTGKLDDAEKLESQALDCCRKIFGDDHPNTLTSMSNLASTYQQKGKLDDAEKLRSQVLDCCRKILGNDHPDTLIAMINLASIYRRKGKLDDAEKLRSQALDCSRKILRDDHPDTLIRMSNLASTYRRKGKLDVAEKLGILALASNERLLGHNHPSTLTMMANLSHTFKGQGRTIEAIELLSECLEKSRQLLNEDHPDIQQREASLGEWRTSLDAERSELTRRQFSEGSIG